MNRIDEKLLEKYFNNTCTAEEAQRVLYWFDTPEGSRYLQKRMHRDEQHYGTVDPEGLARPDSQRMLNVIRQRSYKDKGVAANRQNHWSHLLRAAAAVLVLVLGSIFYLQVTESSSGSDNQTIVHYVTQPDQQRRITLEDGTEIRLNENSNLWISNRVENGVRRVELDGEAFFEVAPNPERVFMVDANESTIRVLGTAFNVKSRPSDENVQVAVVEGRVSFGSLQYGEESSVVLARGEYGYMDLRSHAITVENYGVENYLAWMRGRFTFEDQSLDQICVQLDRLYELGCHFEEESLRNLRLTADFSNDTLDKTILVIAMSLDINYEREENQVYWAPGDDEQE